MVMLAVSQSLLLSAPTMARLIDALLFWSSDPLEEALQSRQPPFSLNDSWQPETT
jgi:hypothetical protein